VSDQTPDDLIAEAALRAGIVPGVDPPMVVPKFTPAHRSAKTIQVIMPDGFDPLCECGHRLSKHWLPGLRVCSGDVHAGLGTLCLCEREGGFRFIPSSRSWCGTAIG
jgi:hypothetical protein